MPRLSPTPITLTERQGAVLERWARSQAKAYRLVQRATLIKEMAGGANNREVAGRTKRSRSTVRLWRSRWLAASPRLAVAEQEGGEEQLLSNLMEEILSDEYRSGTPATFTSEQVVQMVAISCESPAESERPISHWTPREWAAEAVKRKIVESISTRSAGRFLK